LAGLVKNYLEIKESFMAKISIWEKFYKNIPLEEIKKTNPFACNHYLSNKVSAEGSSDDFSQHRKDQITALFDGQNIVSAERIKSLTSNAGRYAAFRTIVHGKAKHDGNGGLIRIVKAENHFPDSLSGKNTENGNYLPTKEDCETAIRQLSDENVQARTGQVLDRIEKNVTSRGMALKPNWRMITEENMKDWSS
jgi:hypothetical protein